MNYCIIDDEPIAHRIIEGYCSKLPHMTKIGNCYNAFEAMQLFSNQSIDIAFLDINMPKLSGFELLKSMQRHPKIIVTTAYKEFALEGYELNITDYLLKPFTFERFLRAINKTVTLESSPSIPDNIKKESLSFFIKGDKKIHHIHTDQLLYIEAQGGYSKLYMTNEMIITHEKISSLEELLPSSDFMRVHKSFIIATKKINTIEGNRITIGEHSIPVGQTYKLHLKQLLDGKS